MKKNILKKNSQQGFSLVEAMVATALIGVGFAGAFTLTSVTKSAADEAVARQKLQMVSSQILEVIESDLDNIDNYNMGLKTCNVPNVGETNKYALRQYEWCLRMNNELNPATATEIRQIGVTTLADGSKVVNIELEARNKQVQVVMKRSYN